MLKTDVSRDAKDFVCRKLMVIGTAASVPALAALLADKDLSHMARYALERIPAPEAAQALRDALPKLSGALKMGVIGSLGVRRDAASVPAWRPCSAMPTRRWPARPRSPWATFARRKLPRPWREAKPTKAEAKLAATDASLACAERLLADGKKAEAMAVYKSFVGDDQPKHVRLAATRGMLACAGK